MLLHTIFDNIGINPISSALERSSIQYLTIWKEYPDRALVYDITQNAERQRHPTSTQRQRPIWLQGSLIPQQFQTGTLLLIIKCQHTTKT